MIFRSDVSHAWIYFHRCVEEYAKTTGLSFVTTFQTMETEFHFCRNDPARFPSLAIILQMATKLKTNRSNFLEELHSLIQKRKLDKKAGKRVFLFSRLNQIHLQQKNYKQIKSSPFFWKAQRNLNQS